jgi:predicted nucleotidyltransferase
VEPALDAIVATVRRVLAAGPPLRLAVLFGSAARGQS